MTYIFNAHAYLKIWRLNSHLQNKKTKSCKIIQKKKDDKKGYKKGCETISNLTGVNCFTYLKVIRYHTLLGGGKGKKSR